ncbi:hypothetical protein GTA62_03830 [Roseobacter sp. HKCCD9010]|uniref:hypothetical protein n=1 Tax=unclassified Roseobacter TaxID=196798 RepID=UPI001491D6B1|nr:MULTISPECIES: hypothetical protein [unclassified Roseobacter]MBF9049002.1 hypothetical protein [Rhodobacterales bacterium HKCCD4356]NNV11002.1 hypothetical protein [Roseobacter sp. HKCCD7357]NNV15186.1 hypothetical protein [Roseobacter sp. HKCCD8768]NNV24646.1 hypothetical protein [Roseobacter sp. HKCCD8192]NNV28902.1 hypothetical protein [Roseobacter sp. HKCCD9061]
MPEKELPVAFTSPEEFHEVMRYLSARMGYINRVAGDEKVFLVEISRILTRLGRLFEDGCKDQELLAQFGSGWAMGTATEEERRMILADALLPKGPPKD